MMHCYFFLAGNLRYTADAAAKSVAGIGVPNKCLVPEYARHTHCCSGTHRAVPAMVARAGAPQGAPVARLSGNANPVRATTLEVGVSGGSCLRSYSLEAALWLRSFPFFTRNLSFFLRGYIMYDPTPLTLEELVDHCRALAYAIIELDNALAKELLIFILWERLNQLNDALQAEVADDE
ncbi:MULTISPECIES: ash family protein [Pectobacterium]|uniref:ash family protein n=1 Tax=Pectobacterium TaxID=122277 RepID=UPI001E2DACF0